MLPMKAAINKEASTSFDDGVGRSAISRELKQLQEKCYSDLMDVCRALADSLCVSTASIMNVQVCFYFYRFYNSDSLCGCI